jgi:hypothetical protein
MLITFFEKFFALYASTNTRFCQLREVPVFQIFFSKTCVFLANYGGVVRFPKPLPKREKKEAEAGARRVSLNI